MLALPQYADTLIRLRPLGFFGRRLHGKLCAGRVACLGHIIRRGYFLYIHRMRKSGWTKPIPGSRLRGRRIATTRVSAGHACRHTAATLALSAGVPAKVVSEQLGHASVAFTLDTYSHVLPHMQEAAAAQVEALLFQLPPKGANRKNRPAKVDKTNRERKKSKGGIEHSFG